MSSGCESAENARGRNRDARKSTYLPEDALTPSEYVVLYYLVERLAYAEIAERMFISVNTVKTHVASVYAKLGVQTGAQAVAEAYRRGLVSLPSE